MGGTAPYQPEIGLLSAATLTSPDHPLVSLSVHSNYVLIDYVFATHYNRCNVYCTYCKCSIILNGGVIQH